MANVTGVAAAVPMLRTSVGKPSERVLLLGVDDNVRAMLSDLQRAVQDQIGPLVTQPGRVAVGAGTGYAQGDSVSVGNGKVTVAAVIGGADAERINGANFIVGPLPLIQRLTDRVGMIDSVLVVAAPGADLARFGRVSPTRWPGEPSSPNRLSGPRNPVGPLRSCAP